MTDIVLVTELEYAKRICNWLNNYFLLLSFDIEGVNLGRDGEITLLQIGISENRVYCFDVLALGDEVFDYLKPIFESEKICKLCYDCRTDADVLKNKYKVKVKYVYDIQVLYTFIFQNEKDPYLKGLCHALNSPGILQDKKVAHNKKEIKESLHSLGSGIFLQRPIKEEILKYCVSDVIYLFTMFYSWSSYVDFNVVIQASMYRLYKYCNRVRSRKMYYVDFKQMPLMAGLTEGLA